MQLNADKTKIVCFQTTQVMQKKSRKVQGKNIWPTPFHIFSIFPNPNSTPHPYPLFLSTPLQEVNLNSTPHSYPLFLSTPLQEVKQIDYLGLRLDPMLTMKPAVASIQERADKGHSLALVVSCSLRYDKHHSNPTLCRSPIEMLSLSKSHLHYAFRAPRADYQDRVCPHCLDKGTSVLGDEIHIICDCPATKGVLHQFTAKFQGLTRLLDLPPFASFTPDEKI